MPFEPILIVGVLIGTLSPLLTFTRLFQMKEWRIDRLSEHVRREGVLQSFLGTTRLAIAAAFLAFAAAVATYRIVNADQSAPYEELASEGIIIDAAFVLLVVFVQNVDLLIGWLAAMGIVSAVQLAGRSRRIPVMTAKAVLILATATAINVLLLTAARIADALLPLPSPSSVGSLLLMIQLAGLALLPLVQPFTVLLAWTVWKPLDWLLKRRLLSRAAVHRATFVDATVIGIVGSVGKTTTKELLKCLLQDKNPVVTPEHVNTELGVAAWMLKNVPRGAKSPFLIVEMGAYRAGEIATLCRVAQPTAAVVTALGSDHLALFGSEEAIVDANAEILDALPEGANVFLYGDNARTAALESRTHRPTFSVGAKDLKDLRETDRGLAFEAFGTRFNAALHGRHNAGNVAVALFVANAFGIAPERLRELLAGHRGPQRTFHLRTERGVLILDDTYNVSPLSFRAAIDWAKDRPERPRTLLTSGLLETGSDEVRFLRELGTAAQGSIERVVFTTDNGRPAFSAGFGSAAELLSPSTTPVPDDGLLICVGRMPPSTIQRLLP